jgi:murein DD-endopeptidase MepM/ murein hydrolase activator NlpD
LASCTPKPKYRGSQQTKTTTQTKQKTATTKTRPKKKPPAPADSPIAFAPPIRNFKSRKISSYFGERRNRYNSIELHKGIDIRATEGEAVLAAAAGEVIFADRQRGFGKVVIIDHGHSYVTLYAHLSSMKVRRGARVQAGDVIGRVGRTGNATGVHLHFEIRIEAKAVNPLDYL